MRYLLIVAALLLFAGCKPGVKPGMLYGTWKYTKLENLNAYPPDTLTSYQLQSNSPSIRFTKSDSVVIIWSDTVLLRGTFAVDGSDINIKQILPGGKTSQFPFSVSKLTDKQIIFESHGADASKVTAAKQ
jgi:hypothetical protein